MNVDLDELTNNGLIDSATADTIKAFYASKNQKETGTRLFQIISILGIILVGLGLILIIGYNWYYIPKWAQISMGFIPLITAQSIGIYTLMRKNDKKVWKEISATSIIAGVAIAMSLLSTIYNLDANHSEFFKWGLILCIPVVLLFDSGVASLICWIGLGIFITSGSLYQNEDKVLFTLGFIISLLYVYVKHVIENRINLTWAWHHLAIPIVFVIYTFALGPYSCQKMVMLHLLILFFALAAIPAVKMMADRLWISIYKGLGFVSTSILAFMYSFKSFWTQGSFHLTENCFTPAGIIISSAFALICIVTIIYLVKSRSWNPNNLFDIKWVIIILGILTLAGNQFPEISRGVVNIILLISSALIIKNGIKDENLLMLNLGIILLAIWVICRFFETDIPLMWKGIIFIVLGLLCFSLNYLLLKRKK